MSNDLTSEITEIKTTLQQLAQMQVRTQQQIDQMGQRLDLSISDLRSTVATLADMVTTHETQLEQMGQRFDQFGQRFDQHIEQANQDRALMFQLIQAIAQGRNGN